MASFPTEECLHFLLKNVLILMIKMYFIIDDLAPGRRLGVRFYIKRKILHQKIKILPLQNDDLGRQDRTPTNDAQREEVPENKTWETRGVVGAHSCQGSPRG